MADGGASSFILLATALLISGSVSAVLISQYGDLAQSMEKKRKGNEADSKTSFEYSGDLSNVAYDTTNPIQTITFYLQNTGVYILDENSLFIQLNGGIILDADTSTTILPAPISTVWESNTLLEVEISGTWGFTDDADVKLTVFAESVLVGGYSGSAIESVEVRLNELS
tara:strand:+ start:1271 stop:1777 length:507 start_codon:yes stop_codon:yes gene_type:complete